MPRSACPRARARGTHPAPRPAPTHLTAALTVGMGLTLPWLFSSPASAQSAPTDPVLNPVVVTGAPVGTDSFDLPYSIDAVDMGAVQRGNLGVNASEALGGLPGLVIRNRGNYAQDLQISIRGFGARAAFGVRGVKLITDGIPASNPDGQGQAATFNLDTAERIEVMRGPFSTVYGNHAGGVIQLFSRDGQGDPTLRVNMLGGSHGTRKYGWGFEGEQAGVGFVLDASRFRTDGYRRNSAAQRDQGFAKFTFNPDQDSRVTLVANSLYQPETEDPQGLTWASYQRNPRAVEDPALTFNTRKRINHVQGGATYERFIGTHTLNVTAYTGKRRVVQYQSIPAAAQAGPRHSGGVIDFDRSFHGLGLRWTAVGEMAGGELVVTTGLDYDRSRDDRQGYQNFVGDVVGIRGPLRRDEIDTITSLDPYIQALWKRGPWQWSAGLRHSRVKFDVRDRYITAANPDDSGSVRFSRSTPALGVSYALTPLVNLYASAGAGFETPTLNELSYATPSTGFNFDLKPSRSQQFEIGTKAFVGEATRINVAAFFIRTRDEIVVSESLGGRTSFTNAGQTRRRGLELAYESEWTPELSARASLTYLDARYSRGFVSGGNEIPSGKRLPGVPALSAYGELAWQPVSGITLASEVFHRSRIEVEDRNQARAAPAHTLVNLRLAAEQNHGNWSFGQMLRVDNAFDRKHVSSVIVGAAGGRFYEPGPGRSWYAGVSARHAF